MSALFELEWAGGAAEHHFRRARPGIDELPWGTFDTASYPPEVLDAGRATWTDAAYTEYRAVAAFAEVIRALAEARAPLDILGMASNFVADEVVHVELTSRVAMELGGAVQKPVDFDALVVKPDPRLSAFQRANEIVLRISCIAEAFSGRMAVSAMRSTTHPLTRAVYERIVADESLHYRLGGIYFDWASELMDDEERARLSRVALTTLKGYGPRWKGTASDAMRATRRTATIEQVHEIGWIETRFYKDQVRAAVRDAIVLPLASYGIEVPSREVDELLA